MIDWRNGIWCVVDTETTGLDINVDRVVEIGISRFSMAEGFISRHCTLVDPGIEITAEASEVHGITNEDVKGKNPLLALAPALTDLFERSDIIVGYNIYGFDEPLLEDEFGEDQWGVITNGRAVIDPLAIVRMDRVGRYWKGKHRHQLGAVAERFQIAVDGAHRAIHDCDATAEILKALIEREPGTRIIPDDANAAEHFLREANERAQVSFRAWLAKQPPKEDA